MKINKSKLVIIIISLLILGGFIHYFSNSKPKSRTESVVIPSSASPIVSATPSPDPSPVEEAYEQCYEFVGSLVTDDMVTLESSERDVSNELEEKEELAKTKSIIRQLNEDAKKGLDLEDQVKGMLSGFASTRTQYSFDVRTKHTYRVISVECDDQYSPTVLVVVDDTDKKVVGVLADQWLAVAAFSDLDGDGSLELLIRQLIGGNCWNCDRLELYRLNNGTINHIVINDEDLFGFGIKEIVAPTNKAAPGFTLRVLDTSWELSGPSHVEGIGLWRFLRVNGQKIEDVTKEYANEVVSRSDETNNLLETLLIYESIGERAKGVNIFEKECLKKIAITKDKAAKEGLNKDILEVKKQFKESDTFHPPLGACKTQEELFNP